MCVSPLSWEEQVTLYESRVKRSNAASVNITHFFRKLYENLIVPWLSWEDNQTANLLMLLSCQAFLKTLQIWDLVFLFPDTLPWLKPLPSPNALKKCYFFPPSPTQEQKQHSVVFFSGSAAWHNLASLSYWEGRASLQRWNGAAVSQRCPLYSSCTSPIQQDYSSCWLWIELHVLRTWKISGGLCDSLSMLP